MKESKLYRFLRPVITSFTNLIFRPNYVGLENLGKKNGFLLAGTHTSNLDCLLLISATKRSVHFLAKAELWKGAKKIIFANMGLIPVDRKKRNPEAVVHAEQYLKDNCIIGIFPEGTTEKGRGLLPFKKGTVRMARDTNSDIIPFAIVGKYRVFKKGLTIVFGEPYKVQSEDLKYENEILQDKIKALIEIGERYGKNT